MDSLCLVVFVVLLPAAALGDEIASCDSILSLHFLGMVSGVLRCKGRLGGWPHSLRCPPWAERAARPGAGGASEPQVTPRVNHPRGSAAEAAAAAAAAAVAVTLCAPRSWLAAGPVPALATGSSEPQHLHFLLLPGLLLLRVAQARRGLWSAWWRMRFAGCWVLRQKDELSLLPLNPSPFPQMFLKQNHNLPPLQTNPNPNCYSVGDPCLTSRQAGAPSPRCAPYFTTF